MGCALFRTVSRTGQQKDANCGLSEAHKKLKCSAVCWSSVPRILCSYPICYLLLGLVGLCLLRRSCLLRSKPWARNGRPSSRALIALLLDPGICRAGILLQSVNSSRAGQPCPIQPTCHFVAHRHTGTAGLATNDRRLLADRVCSAPASLSHDHDSCTSR